MSFTEAFQTVDIIVRSNAPSRAVDAFALSLIKAERQLRKLFTYLIYQYPCFSFNDIGPLREALASNTNVYFEGLQRGFDSIYPKTIKILIGEDYERLLYRLAEASKHRNKIFHGQITSLGLSRDELLGYVEDLRLWCSTLGEQANLEIGYDGFGQNSFQKSTIGCLYNRFKLPLDGIDGYKEFIRTTLERQRNKTGR